jgi:hypothetical protein
VADDCAEERAESECCAEQHERRESDGDRPPWALLDRAAHESDELLADGERELLDRQAHGAPQRWE